MHIPKSAGTALTNALLRLEPYKHEVHGWDRSLFGSYNDFHTWDQGRRPWLFLSPDEIEEKKNFISGHIGYSNIRKRYRNAYVFSIIRNPFNRLLSHWLFWRGKPDGLESDIGNYARHVYSARMPLCVFLNNSAIAPQIDNVAARMLLWPHPLIPDDDFIDDRNVNELISQAWERLNEFEFVDLYENPNWLDNFQTWLGQELELRKENETEIVPDNYRSNILAEITPETRDLIKLRIRVDEGLWNRLVQQKFGSHALEKLKDSVESTGIANFNVILSGISRNIITL